MEVLYNLYKHKKMYVLMLLQVTIILCALIPNISLAYNTTEEIKSALQQVNENWVFEFDIPLQNNTNGQLVGQSIKQLQENEDVLTLNEYTITHFSAKQGLTSYKKEFDIIVNDMSYTAQRGAVMDNNALKKFLGKDYPEFGSGSYELSNIDEEIPIIIGKKLKDNVEIGALIPVYDAIVQQEIKYRVVDVLDTDIKVLDINTGKQVVLDNTYIVPPILYSENLVTDPIFLEEQILYQLSDLKVYVSKELKPEYIDALQYVSAYFEQNNQHIPIISSQDAADGLKSWLNYELELFAKHILIILAINLFCIFVICALIIQSNSYENAVLYMLGKKRRTIIGVQIISFIIIQIVASILSFMYFIVFEEIIVMELYAAINIMIVLLVSCYIGYQSIKNGKVEKILKKIK